jgi:hypothetical protein
LGSNDTLADAVNAMSSMIVGNTSRGGVSSMVAGSQVANLFNTLQSQQNDYVEKAIKLKLSVKGKDYDWEVDAGLNDKSIKQAVNEITNVFYPFLLSQYVEEMYVPPAVLSYLKLLSSYKSVIPKNPDIYLAGYINDIKIYRMPEEVFKDDFTCVCHTKYDEWTKAKITNVSGY